jgi:hypothetical protein
MKTAKTQETKEITAVTAISIWHGMANYLSMSVDILKMTIQILDHNRIATDVQKKFSKQPSTQKTSLTTLGTTPHCSSSSDDRQGFP